VVIIALQVRDESGPGADGVVMARKVAPVPLTLTLHTSGPVGVIEHVTRPLGPHGRIPFVRPV
jgi:hypothetical protein